MSAARPFWRWGERTQAVSAAGRGRRRLRPGEPGYTLIEVMAAVAIIAVLMSILIYGLAQYRRTAFQKGTLALLTNVKSALGAYYSTYRQYPPDGYDSVVKRTVNGQAHVIKGSQCLVYFLGFPLPVEVEIGQDTRVQEQPPFLDLNADMLAGEGGLEERLADPATELVDKYNNALHYDNVERDESGNVQVSDQTDKHVEDGAMTTAPDPRRVPGSTGGGAAGGLQAKNPGAYDLWSHGYKIADTADDITNWK